MLSVTLLLVLMLMFSVLFSIMISSVGEDRAASHAFLYLSCIH